MLLIALISAAALYVIWPSEPDRFLPAGIPWPEGRGIAIGDFERREMRLGLDLQGGTRLLLGTTAPPDLEGAIDDAIDGTIATLRRRVDAVGVAEAEITSQGSSYISVQLPGLDPEEAKRLLGRTALLRFCEQAAVADPGLPATPCDDTGQWLQSYGVIDGEAVALTGRFLKPNAFVGTDAIGQPTVVFEWRDDGPELSEQITGRLLGQNLGIFLDDELLTAPVVQSVIRDTGSISPIQLNRARQLVAQLNSGALPLQITVLQEQQVDATLGADSVRRSVVASEVGLLLVALFMVLYYRFPGALAAVALGVYTLLTLALFKLIPVTLTLAGIGAFVLSVGMAVDANILIFERMKEELRAGRGYTTAIEVGFRRAWPAIRDSNASTLITCAILWILGGGLELPVLGTFDAPLVQGFAVTLAIGVVVSMLSAILVTRSLLRLFVGTEASRGDWLGVSTGPADGTPGGGDA